MNKNLIKIIAMVTLQIPLALLNARMSMKSFQRWSIAPAQALMKTMLSAFSLIVPLVLFYNTQKWFPACPSSSPLSTTCIGHWSNNVC